MKTRLFVGADLSLNSSGVVAFQDPKEVLLNGRYDSNNFEPGIERFRGYDKGVSAMIADIIELCNHGDYEEVHIRIEALLPLSAGQNQRKRKELIEQATVFKDRVLYQYHGFTSVKLVNQMTLKKFITDNGRCEKIDMKRTVDGWLNKVVFPGPIKKTNDLYDAYCLAFHGHCDFLPNPFHKLPK